MSAKRDSQLVDRPSRAALLGATNKVVADLTEPGLAVLFCGINPGLYSAVTGQHFARPGNRFWKVLALAGLTERELHPSEGAALLAAGIGITNLVERASATAAELGRDELRAGATLLEGKVRRLRPVALAMLGAGAWRTAVDRRAPIGKQDGAFGGALVYVLPNPSGLQARYQLDELVALFAPLAELVEARRQTRGSAR